MADYTGINKVGQVANVGGGPGEQDDQRNMLATMRSRLTMAVDAYSDSRSNELDDLRFMAGSPDNQWHSCPYSSRLWIVLKVIFTASLKEPPPPLRLANAMSA